MTTRPCPICQQPHARSVDCHGTPIDGPAQWRCAACGGAHGPDRLCDGTLNYEWHVMPSNRIRVRAKMGEKQK